jgi:hypothetical protein
MPVVLVGDTLTFLADPQSAPQPDKARACDCFLCDPRLVHAADWHADGEAPCVTLLPPCPRGQQRAR